MNPALRQLRAATAEQHRRLEDGLDVLRRCSDPHDYRVLLERFWAVHVSLEPALAEAARRHAIVWTRDVLSRLAADLVDLGSDPSALASGTAPILPTADDVWGSLYVVEGAALGGGLIAEVVQKHALPGRFFAGEGEDRGRRWRQFRHALGSWLATDGDADSVQAAACRTFAAFEAALEDRGTHVAAADLEGAR